MNPDEVTPPVEPIVPVQTNDDLLAIIKEQGEKIDQLSSLASSIEEIKESVAPKVDADEEDLKYTPASWKALQDRQEKVSEETARRIIQEAESEKKRLQQEEVENRKKNQQEIDKQITQLETDGVIAKTSADGDEGFKQREQVFGYAVNFGTTDLVSVAKHLKSLWDNGLSYDFQKNEVTRTNAQAYFTPPPIGSSAHKSNNSGKSPIDLRAVRGDLDKAEAAWLANNS